MSLQTPSQLLNLRLIFDNRNIVKSYQRHQLVELLPPPRARNISLIQQDGLYQDKSTEEGLLDQLCKVRIVENYQMLDEKEEEKWRQQQGKQRNEGREGMLEQEQICKERECVFVQKRYQSMLDSSSEDIDLPARSSSLSSVSLNGLQLGVVEHLESSCQKRRWQGTTAGKNDRGEAMLEEQQVDLSQQGNQCRAGSILTAQNHQMSSELSQSSFNTPRKYNKPVEVAQTICRVREEHKNEHRAPRVSRRELGSSKQRAEKLQKIRKLQMVGCNCRKTKCLKMYCQCFNLQIFCSQNCCCCQCSNKEPNKSHQQAILEALTRNPKAFTPQNQQIDMVFELGLQLGEVKKGCKCKKTRCLKKYCECYNSEQTCGKFCQCEGCSNGEQ